MFGRHPTIEDICERVDHTRTIFPGCREITPYDACPKCPYYTESYKLHLCSNPKYINQIEPSHHE